MRNYLIATLIVVMASCQCPQNSEQEKGKNETSGEISSMFLFDLPIGGHIPMPWSDDIAQIAFTGRYANYTDADTWYPSWAGDGNLYSPWTDGNIGEARCYSFDLKDNKASTGQAKITGNDPMNLKVENLGTIEGDPAPYEGRYPCGSLVYDGVWYFGTYCLTGGTWGAGMNWPVQGPFVGFHVSHDYGKTWEVCPLSGHDPLFGEHTDGETAKPVKFGAPHFVDFGKNMEHSPDGMAYMVGHGAREDDPRPRPGNLSWISGDQVYMARVKPSPETMNDGSAWEYFAGRDENGQDIWTQKLDEAKPIYEWNNHCGCVTMTYNAPLDKYLMCITDGWPTVKQMDSYILESDHITGPWEMVSYLYSFGPQAYFVNIPSKFISEDGKTAWLCYSANFTYMRNDPHHLGDPEGSKYALSLHEIKFLDTKELNELSGNKPESYQLPHK